MVSCVYMPAEEDRFKLFNEMLQDFDRSTAAFLYNKTTSEQFMDMYKDTLVFDGSVPTYESILNNELVKKYLGLNRLAEIHTKHQPVVENTLDNADKLLDQAYKFNNSANNTDFIAYVEPMEDNALTIKVEPRTQETKEIADNQRRITTLNRRIAEILSPAGITVGTLSEWESGLGRVGVTDFNRAKEAANGLASIISVANNLEGSKALSEEFAHFIIGVYRDNPVIARSLAALQDPDMLKYVLGDMYQEVDEYYDGNLAMMAEEALGQIFRDTLLNFDTNANLNIKKVPTNIFKRALNHITSLFKGYNPAYIADTVNYVQANMNALANEILTKQTTLTKEDIEKAQRSAKFNALSEKAKAQIDKLKKIEKMLYKNRLLQNDIKTKDGTVSYSKRAAFLADKVAKKFDSNVKQGESLAAVADFIEAAYGNLDRFFEDLNNIEKLSTKNKFILLRNVLNTLQLYSPVITDLKEITESSYLQNPDIAKQRFALGDAADSLTDYEVKEDIDEVNTSNMTTADIADLITKESDNQELSEDETHYVNQTTHQKSLRVTKVISASSHEAFDEDSPWLLPSTNIGTGIDEFIRDFLSDKIVYDEDSKSYRVVDSDDNTKSYALEEVYPNASNEDLNKFAEQLSSFKQEQKDKGITLISRDVTINGVITSLDSSNKPHKISVVGTLDLLGYDDEGNWYVYDIKTYRSDIDDLKKAKYDKQINLYRMFLEQKYGIKVKEMGVLPVKVSYDTPAAAGGTVKYDLSHRKHQEYDGREGNQLLVDGQEFKGAQPQMQKLMPVEKKNFKINYRDLGGESSENIEHMLATLDSVDRLYLQLKRLFDEKSRTYFTNFIKSYIGENVLVRQSGTLTHTAQERMQLVNVESILDSAPKDVSWIQRWLTSAADNPDTFIQTYAKIVSDQKHKQRLTVIEKSNEILAFAKKYEKLGIKDYAWMFEADKQHYIRHFEVDGKDYSHDESAYQQALRDYTKQLNEIYGEFPEVGSQAFKEKQEALNQWLGDNNVVIVTGTGTAQAGHTYDIKKRIPNPELYPSKYSSLSSLQKQFLDEFLALKNELDQLLPPGTTTVTNTIKIRQSWVERAKGIGSTTTVQDYVESVKSHFFRAYDDDLTYTKNLQYFSGKPVDSLPIYYLHAKNAHDITTDVIGSLITYADMAYGYYYMNEVVNQLEIGRYMAQQRKIQKREAGKPVGEEFSYRDSHSVTPIYEGADSGFLSMLDDFMESKVYRQYFKDAGVIPGTKVDTNKIASFVLKIGSMTQLGFNALAGLSNASTGIGMQNIEAVAGEFFSAKELSKADWIFMKSSLDFLGDIGQRTKKSKLALFGQMFDVRQDFSKNVKGKDYLTKNILLRVFGPNLQYIFQDIGDHWLYNRSAIAIALKHKLLDGSGKEISLWDALEVVPIDPDVPEAGNQLVFKEGVTNLDGTNVTTKDITQIAQRMTYVNQHCFGIYNNEDAIAARRIILGRFMMQYRDWLPAQYRYRFGSMTTNFYKGENQVVEGYYRTLLKFCHSCFLELKDGSFNLAATWNNLEDFQKKNIRRAIYEMFQVICLYILKGLLSGKKKDDDEKPSYVKQLLRYTVIRASVEQGALVPFSAPIELLKIAQSPMAATNVASDVLALKTVLWPGSWFEEVEHGEYKGHSEAYRALMRSPLSIYYNTIKRQLNPDKAAEFYNKF